MIVGFEASEVVLIIVFILVFALLLLIRMSSKISRYYFGFFMVTAVACCTGAWWLYSERIDLQNNMAEKDWLNSGQSPNQHDHERYAKAKALFDERCKTAGENIYRVVEDVEGVFLDGIRRDALRGNESKINWAGAGFPLESAGEFYVMEFLYYHQNSGDPNVLEGVLPIPVGSRGYEYVDVVEDGSRLRYSLRSQKDYILTSSPVDAYGRREPVEKSAPRYAVSYENIDDPEGRLHWIAGGRVKVFDRYTGEILGESVRYSFETQFGATTGGRQPWAFSHQCPQPSKRMATSGHIRLFVEKVLKPKIQSNSYDKRSK